MDEEKTKVGLEPEGNAEPTGGEERVAPAEPKADGGSEGGAAPQAGHHAPTVNVMVGERKEEESRSAAAVYAPRQKRMAFQVIDFIFWLGSALLLLRFALKLVAANPGNSFVLFIYNLTERSVGVFAGIVNDIRLAEGEVPYLVEISTLIAWLVFWIAYMIANKLITMFTTAK